MDKERKPFEQWKVDIAYKECDGICVKCGNTLALGFHRHHKDSDNSNNSVENLELLCPSCHGSEKFKTLQEQKKKHLGEIELIVKQAIEGKMAGAVLDKLMDSIKLALSLEKQLYGDDIEEPPISVKVEMSQAIMEYNYREWLKGIKEGVALGIELAKEVKEKKGKQ